MQIIISSRHTEISDALDAAVRNKVRRLERFDHDIRIARVHFTHEATARAADREQCEIMLEGNGERIVTRVSGPDGFASLDGALAKIEHQLAGRRSVGKGRGG